MFHFPAAARGRCRPHDGTAGFPIRKSSDQKPCPGHIAASNVLHRYCLPRHPPYALASNPHDPSGNGGKPQAHGKNSAGNTNHHTNDHTQNDQTPDSEESGEINSRRHPQKGVPCSRPLSSSQTHAPARHPPHRGTGDRHGARNTSHAKRRGVAVREPKSMPRTTPGRTARDRRPKGRLHSSTSSPTHPAHRGRGTTAADSGLKISVEREVIQPHLPVRLPCST